MSMLLGIGVCAMTAAGHDSMVAAVAEWPVRTGMRYCLGQVRSSVR